MAVSRNQLAILAVVPVVIDDLFDNTVELLVKAAIDEDVDVLVNILNQRNPKIARIQKYCKETVPLFNHAQFRYYFRMQRETVDELEQLLMQCREVPSEYNMGRGRPAIPLRKQILIYLWFLGNNEPYEHVAGRFDVALSSAFVVAKRISDAMVNNYRNNFIKWLIGPSADQVIANFQEIQGFPGVLGATDGSHIPIRAPNENPNDYVNRKKFHSIVLQVVCDSELLITDAFCGYPGRVHDARVSRNGPLLVFQTIKIITFLAIHIICWVILPTPFYPGS